MKTRIAKRIGGGMIAVVLSQVLLAGCATTNRNTPEEQKKLAHYEQTITRKDGLGSARQ